GVNDRPVRTWSIAPPASPPAWFLRGCVRHRCSSDDRHPPGSPPSSSTRRLRPVACCNATPATGATQNAPQKGRTKLIRRFPKLKAPPQAGFFVSLKSTAVLRNHWAAAEEAASSASATADRVSASAISVIQLQRIAEIPFAPFDTTAS